MSPAHALRVAGRAAGDDDATIEARVQAFDIRLREADDATAKRMIDDPTGWDREGRRPAGRWGK